MALDNSETVSSDDALQDLKRHMIDIRLRLSKLGASQMLVDLSLVTLLADKCIIDIGEVAPRIDLLRKSFARGEGGDGWDDPKLKGNLDVIKGMLNELERVSRAKTKRTPTKLRVVTDHRDE